MDIVAMKPLGFYTNYTPGETSYLEEIQEKYGSHLEGINVREKLYLIECISSNLGIRAKDAVRPEMHWVAQHAVKELEPCDQEGLIEALITHVRHSE